MIPALLLAGWVLWMGTFFRDGTHYWNYLESYQTFLECSAERARLREDARAPAGASKWLDYRCLPEGQSPR